MKHSIVFKNAENHWDNGLPLGNGIFGAMLYFEKNMLYMPMNHYEIYYNIRENVLPKDLMKEMPDEKNPGEIEEITRRIADESVPPEGEPYSNYGGHRSNSYKRESYPVNALNTYPQTGEFRFNFCDCVKGADQKLTMYVEDAKAEFQLKNDCCEINIDTIVAREDVIINHVKQSKEAILKSFDIYFWECRKSASIATATPPDVTYTQVDKNTIAYTVKYILDNKDFFFTGIIKLCGAEAEVIEDGNNAKVTIKNASKDFYILTGVFTDWKYKDTLADGLPVMEQYTKNIPALYDEHKKYWDEFFARSNISIPDKFLEHIYYVNQYALDCCSGKDGIMKHHACGLNGLWNVRHPSLWGSKWYWDVNIQAAFAGVFSSNRLDLAKVFSDGLLSFVDLAKKSAKNMHNAGGIAADYPYTFYYSCWPWCAQYLWFLYEYSLDKEYLEKDAFPVFVGLCEFFCDVYKYDEERGYFTIYPDVSPEQGPYAHDTVITTACVKYLLKFTLEAGKILGKELPVFEKCREILNNMAPYPISGLEGKYGKHFKDSPEAPSEMGIRHPSMLMPLFPIGEFDIDSDPEMVKVLSNTIDFLSENAEIGVFQGSWISACASRLGRGQTALRVLYERGIDHMLRSNGLTAEETDRFINYCLIPRQPIYYPCMMEFTGEMLAAVNEMLIQSHNGIIRVFPAIPDGDKEYERAFRHGYPLSECFDRFADYEAWNDVRIDKLLCKGAFEVTAELEDGKIKFIEVLSKKGGKVRVTSPFIDGEYKVFCDGAEVAFEMNDNIFSFNTEEGKKYVIAKSADVCTKADNQEYNEEILKHYTYTKRNIFLGEDPETNYHKALDYFTRDWYLGNLRMENRTVYKFDFTNNAQKEYAPTMERQGIVGWDRMIAGMRFYALGENDLEFTAGMGFGFADASGITLKDAGCPDELRRDFLTSSDEVEFVIEAPRGQYELFVVSGDADEENVTIIEAVNGMKAGGDVVKKGEYQCKIVSLINEYDEPIRLKIATKPGYNWKVNYIMLNAIKGY